MAGDLARSALRILMRFSVNHICEVRDHQWFDRVFYLTTDKPHHGHINMDPKIFLH